MEKKYNRKLSWRIIFMCVMLISILCTIITVAGYRMYKKDMKDRYREYVNTILNIAKDGVNADKLQESIYTGKENEEYSRLFEKLGRLKENANIRYLYILYFPDANDEKNMNYVMNGCTKEQLQDHPETVNHLGEKVLQNDFQKEMQDQLYLAFTEKEEKIAYIENYTAEQELVITAYFPLKDEQNNTICLFCVDILVNQITNQLHKYIKTVIVEVICVGAVFFLVLIVLMEKQVIAPIRKLAFAAENCMTENGDNKEEHTFTFDRPIIHTKDEIQLLSDSMNDMVIQIQEYMKKVSVMTADKERVNAQFEIITQLKQNLFPYQFPVYQERTDFYLYAHTQNCKNAAGDFYNFFLIDKSHLCFFMGTASGYGISTIMVAVITAVYMENYAEMGYEPYRILAKVNNHISENSASEITVNTCISIVDLKTGELTYACAGDMPVLVKQSGQKVKAVEGQPGIRLGFLKNAVYTQTKMVLSQGDCMYLYSNGLPRRADNNGNIFTHEYVMDSLIHMQKKEFDLMEIIDGVFMEIERFASGSESLFDQTMLGFRYMGE